MVPQEQLDTRTRAVLDGLDGQHVTTENDTARVQMALEPLWGFAVALLTEDQEAPVPVEACIEQMICIRSL